jgi:hypothetical protein
MFGMFEYYASHVRLSFCNIIKRLRNFLNQKQERLRANVNERFGEVLPNNNPKFVQVCSKSEDTAPSWLSFDST